MCYNNIGITDSAEKGTKMTWEIAVGMFGIISAFIAVMNVVVKINTTLSKLEAAVIQLKEYHLYPDGDYTDFCYYDGLPMLDDFYLEVHYRNLDIQDESVRKCLKERGKTVYVTHDHSGGIIVENGRIRIIGSVDVYGELENLSK